MYYRNVQYEDIKTCVTAFKPQNVVNTPTRHFTFSTTGPPCTKSVWSIGITRPSEIH